MLYVSVGSNSNAAENGLEAEKGRAAIWQIDRQTGAARVFASGLRNPNGLTFHPQTGELWTVVNERDELGPNLVPDYMTSVEDGGFYGWPWSYYGDHVDPRVYPPRPDMVEKAIKPDYALSSHVAALGMAFTEGSAMPQVYANGAFVGNRGSWNRDSFNGYKVVYIPFENGKPSAKTQDVVTGFISGEEARGRPVGLGIDGTGALLVADDAGNTVWRVASSDGTVIPQTRGTDGVPTNVQGSTNLRTGRIADTASAIASDTGTPQTSQERLTGQEAISSAPEKLRPAQMQIAPATGP
jgi:glucose/arabinose dehydrogenase